MNTGLRGFILKPGNCLSSLGAVRAAALLQWLQIDNQSVYFNLFQHNGQQRALRRLRSEF